MFTKQINITDAAPQSERQQQQNNVTISINGLQVMSANSDQRITICSTTLYQEEDMAAEATRNTVTMNVPANVPISIKSPKQMVLQLTPVENEPEEEEISLAVEDSVTSRNKTHVVNLTVRIKPTGEVTTLQGPLSIE